MINATRPHIVEQLRIEEAMEDECFPTEKRVRSEYVIQLLAGPSGTPMKVEVPSVLIPDVSLFRSLPDSVPRAVPLISIEIKGSCAWPFHDMWDEHNVREIIRKCEQYFDMNPEKHCEDKEFVVRKRVTRTSTFIRVPLGPARSWATCSERATLSDRKRIAFMYFSRRICSIMRSSGSPPYVPCIIVLNNFLPPIAAQRRILQILSCHFETILDFFKDRMLFFKFCHHLVDFDDFVMKTIPLCE